MYVVSFNEFVGCYLGLGSVSVQFPFISVDQFKNAAFRITAFSLYSTKDMYTRGLPT